MRRIAVTGATGFIGRHLVAALAAAGDDVLAITRPSSSTSGMKPWPPGVTPVRATLERESLGTAFRGVGVVVHLAGIVASVRDDEFRHVNVRGTQAVAEAARTAGAHLVNVSSLAASGPAPASAPRSEDDAPAPITAYGRSKLEAERLVASMPELRWTVLRPGIVYGPGDRALRPLFQAASRGLLPLIGKPASAYSIVHVSDLVSTIAAAIEHGPTGSAIFVAHPRPVSARELTEAVRDAVGSRPILLPVPMSVMRVIAWAGDVAGTLVGRPMPMNSRRYVELKADGFVCRVDRLRDTLGQVAAIDLTPGLASTAQWYRDAGWL